MMFNKFHFFQICLLRPSGCFLYLFCTFQYFAIARFLVAFFNFFDTFHDNDLVNATACNCL